MTGPGPVGMLAGGRVYRVHWLPGTDRLHGVCHCGAERSAEEPVELWDWLLAHPAGHQQRRVAQPPPRAEPQSPVRLPQAVP